MIFNRRVLLILFLLSPNLLSAQDKCTSAFFGSVLSSDGEALPGATIVLNNDVGKVADVQGTFRFNNLCDGRYTVVVSFLGFESVKEQIQVRGEVMRVFVLKTESTKLDEVIVSEKTPDTEHSQNFVTLGEKDLAATAGKTLGETLREVPGVNSIQAGPGIFKPVIHGVHSTRILILNHGIRQEGQQWGAEHAPEIDPFVASQITVVKDASAIKYGTDAIGGVIIVNPPDLPAKAGLGGLLNMVAQTNGRAGTISGMLEGGIANHDGWGWRVQGTAKRAGDYHTPTYQLTNTGSKEFDFSAATGYHNSKFGADVFYSRFQTQLGILKGTAISNLDDLVTAMEKAPPQFTTPFSYSIGEPRQEVVHQLLKVTAHTETSAGDFHFQYGFQSNSRKEFDIRRGGLSQLPAIDLQLNTHTIEGEWERVVKDVRSFCVGFNGMYQANSNIPGTQRIPFIPNYSSFSGGPFVVTKFFLQQWTVDLGARYDFRQFDVTGYDFKNTLYRSSLLFKNVSATAGLIYSMKAGQSLGFNVSTAWRPPHVAELYSLGTHQSAAAIEYGLLLNDKTNEVMNINDVDFKIEKAFKAVTTYKITRDQFQLEATAYANYILNYIYLKPTGITQNVRGTYPYFRYTQTNALFTGLDLSVVTQPTAGLSLTPRVSLLRASDVTNKDYLMFIPSNRFELNGKYEWNKLRKMKGLFAEVKLKYTMRQFRAPRVITVRELKEATEVGTNPFANDQSNFDFMAAPYGYFLLGAAAGFTLPVSYGQYEFRLSAENLLNSSYREYTNRFRYYADELGRNVVTSVRFTF